jgi:uncharacterized protein
MSDYLDLYDYRCRMSALYRERSQAEVLGEGAITVLQRFRQGKDELFAHHPQSALDEAQRRHFQGLHYFPYHPAMRFSVVLEMMEEPISQQIVINAKEALTLVTVGHVSFGVDGQAVTLAIYWLEIYGGGLFLPFRDTTCPQESYGGGRYLFDTIKGSEPLWFPGQSTGDRRQMVLDFNYAYNPSCAYNSRWVCPLAPAENYLSVAIRAGEQKYEE